MLLTSKKNSTPQSFYLKYFLTNVDLTSHSYCDKTELEVTVLFLNQNSYTYFLLNLNKKV